jgi:hypothetical protein
VEVEAVEHKAEYLSWSSSGKDRNKKKREMAGDGEDKR